MMQLRAATEQDHTFISVLLSVAFERQDEARLVEKVRASGEMALELVAEEAGEVVGHIAFIRLVAPPGFWALAPVSVIRKRQHTGIGSEIIRYGLDLARRARARAVVVVGDPRYYGRFGFSVKAAENLISPFPKAFTQLYPIAPGTAGVEASVIYPVAFADL